MPFEWQNLFFNNQAPPPAPSEQAPATVDGQWDFYECTVDHKRAMVFVNLALMKQAPNPRYPSLVWLTLTVQAPRPDGLAEGQELERLNQIEDNFENTAIWAGDAILLGRVGHAGVRDYFFQAVSPEPLRNALSEVMAKYPEYRFELGSREDPEWSTYREYLHPSPRQSCHSNDSKVRLALKESGDTLDKEREIEHWVYFTTPQARDEFVHEIARLGFVLVSKDDGNDGEVGRENPYMAQISRSDVPNGDFTEKVSWPLTEAAERLGGDYDGWETFVVK